MLHRRSPSFVSSRSRLFDEFARMEVPTETENHEQLKGLVLAEPKI